MLDRPLVLLFAAVLFAAVLLGACGSTPAASATKAVVDTVADTVADANADSAVPVADSPEPDAPPDTGDDAQEPSAPSFCTDRGLTWEPFSSGPYGTLRHQVAADFSLDVADGSTWNFKENYTGCEVTVFVTDLVPVSELNPASVWDSAKDLDTLIKKSPDNVHYFFLSLKQAAPAAAAIAAMQGRVTAATDKLSGDAQAHWQAHLHVVAARGQDLSNWIGKVAVSHGQIGFTIDRFQRIRGFGNLSDVTRQKPNLQAAGKWPWESNLAYAAYEAQYLNADAALALKIKADAGKEVPLWQGETLAEYATAEVDLGKASDLQGYDTLQVEVNQRCPNDDAPELGNCGAWDYLAGLSVWDQTQQKNIEIARFITSYHRETHWLVDISAMQPLLAAGGKQLFRWDFAPSWNTQPTKTWLKLRFVKKNKPYRAKSLQFLWSGGDWNSKFDTLHPDQLATIPTTAKRVELWALITGHGQDPTTSCAEFCNHQHVFSVGGKEFVKDHPLAGTNNQCIPNVDKGMAPNQAGTWWFGRGGWCPGMQVEPWVADITDAVQLGKAATVSYHGLLKGAAPPGAQGNIDGAVWLVVYE